jgi:hypothetical protein
VWATDSNGNYVSNLITVAPGASVALEGLEPTFGQDLNGDGTIGLTKTVIQTDGSTSLTLVANQNYYLLNSGGSGPSVKYGGADVVVGEFGPWHPIGAVQTASGYDIAWKLGTDQYSVWATDSNGNYVSNLITVAPAASAALQGLEPTFGQDLNGDGTIGVIGAAGSTSATSASSAATLTVAQAPAIGALTVAYSTDNGTSSAATSTISDSAQITRLAVFSQYMEASFATASADDGDRVITDATSSLQSFLAQPH